MKIILRIIKILLCLAFVAFLILSASSFFTTLLKWQPVESLPFVYASAVPAAAPPSDVAFSAGSFPVDTEELTVVLQPGETALLDQLPALKSADLRGSAALDEILSWAQAHPEVALRYNVLLPNGELLDNDVTSASLAGVSAEQAEQALSALKALPELREIDLGSADKVAALSGAQIAALREAFPEAEIKGSLRLLGKSVDPGTESLELTELRHADVADASAALALLPQLKSISLGSEAESDLSWEDLRAIAAACPGAVIDYSFSRWGKTLNLSDEMLDLNHIHMDDRGAAVREILPCMTRCKVLDMDSCGVGNEDMAVIRDENPNVDVVWRIWFGTDYSVRTNVTKILASKPSKGGTLYDDVGNQLKYCTKVRYLDLGHNFDISDFGFVRNMPELEVVGISMTGISDLSPFSSCSKLKWMEAGNCKLSDLSPLAECKALRHLNVGTNSGVKDISPLYDLELKRLWLGVGDPVPSEQVAEMRSRHPKCEVNVTVPTGLEKDAKGNNLNEGYVQEYWKCYQQYLAADWEFYAANGSFPAQRPLGWWKVVFKAFQYNLADGAYSFSWNDPKLNPHDPGVAPVNTFVIDTSFLDEDFVIPETIIPDKLDDPPGEILYESTY